MLQDQIKQVPHCLNVPDIESFLPSLGSGGFWAGLPESIRLDWIQTGRKALAEGIPALPATLYLDFRRTGNRVRFEEPYFRRRILLLRMTLAYAGGDRTTNLLDGIINMLCAVCDEWTWVIPAHNWPDMGSENSFPPVNPPRVDLFAANTASLLAMVVHILNIPLLEEADRLLQRVRQECRRRCINPYMENNAHWWMGYERMEGHGELNNWTPWITENFLHTLFLLRPSAEELSRGTVRAGEILNHYLDVLLPDGGCDEGPSYWDHAVGSLYGCLEILDTLSGSSLCLLEDDFLKRAVSYIHRVYIGDFYFTNYADCPGVLNHLPLGLMYRMGIQTGDTVLVQLSAYLQSRTGHHDYDGSVDEAFSTFRVIRNLMNPIPDQPLTIDLVREGTDLFPDSQIYIKRRGDLFFSCKGGHNHESHNHNDVGHFVLYGGGRPLILDPGVGEYTRETFSHKRYSIWTMQSGWHNLPVINGVEQKEGRSFFCSGFDGDDNHCLLFMENAYPEKAGLLSWKRQFSFPPDSHSVLLKDSWESRKDENVILWNLILPSEPEAVPGGFILDSRGKKMQILFPQDQLKSSVNFQEIPPDDAKMGVWGLDRIWRLSVRGRFPSAGSLQFTIHYQGE